MKKAILLLAKGFEEIEAVCVVDVLRRANIKCDLCSIDEEYVEGTHNILIKSDCNIDNINSEEYDCVILPGGLPGATNLEDKRVAKLVKEFNDDNRIIGAICAAPQTLETFGILKDRKCTSYPGFIKEKDKVNYIEEIVAVDENIITSRGPATSIAFALEILRKLGKISEADEIQEGMMVNFYNKNIK